MRIKLRPGDLVRLAPRAAAREADIQKAVVAALEAAGCLVVRVNGGLLPRSDGGRMRCSTATEGTCVDLLVQTPTGRFVALEVKRPGGTPTPGQGKFLAAVRARGGVGVVVTSADDARAALAAAGPG
jgi:hypothetical protein